MDNGIIKRNKNKEWRQQDLTAGQPAAGPKDSMQDSRGTRGKWNSRPHLVSILEGVVLGLCPTAPLTHVLIQSIY